MPDLLRPTLSLDGFWDFRHGTGPWRQAEVPMPWQAQFADLRQASGTGTYRRSFAVADPGPDHHWVLRFGAVSYSVVVTLNGTEIGRNEGGYLPFDCPIPPDLLRAENRLELTAHLPDGGDTDPPFAEIPHGKQSWYGPIGGIWQSVTLERRHRCHLTHCAIAADLTSGRVILTLSLSTAAEASVTLFDPDGAVVAQGGTDLTIADVRPWHPDTPALYTAQIKVKIAGQEVDTTTHTFGFRSFAARDGKLFLNGAPFYMRAALDQDYYPIGICTPPSLAFLEDQLGKAKALGLNMLRCHIKVPDPRYYEVADRLGMLIWTEIPNVASFTDASARRMTETMQGMLARDGNHPCIVIWTIINEDWGTRLIEDASHRAWVAGMYDWLKAADPTRLVVDNSPCHQNFHVKSDLDDFHYYRSVPERRSEWDAITADFASRPGWTYSPEGDAQRRGTEPLIVSEFGVWGLPDPALVANPDGSEPWWMETGSVWGDGVAYPHGLQNRFVTYRLDSVFDSFQHFVDAAQWYQFANLKYQIEVMRSHASIMGYVITEFTDVHWESNGLLDMNRNPRIFHDRFAEINADLVILPNLPSYAGYGGDALTMTLSVASGAAQVPEGVMLEWSMEGSTGTVAVPAGAPCEVTPLGDPGLTLPEVAENRMVQIGARLSLGGRTLARNSFPVAAYARRNTERLPQVATDDPVLAAHADGLGYPVGGASAPGVRLVRGLGAEDIQSLQSGRRYVVLADGTAPLTDSLRLDKPPHMLLPDIGLAKRDGTIWRGDWIAGFSWIRRKGAFATLPGGPLLDLSYDRVVPHHVMTGFRPWEYGGAVHSGLVVGWVHKPAALIAERRVGRGGLVASTFRLLGDTPGSDPVAAALFDAIIATAAMMAVEE